MEHNSTTGMTIGQQGSPHAGGSLGPLQGDSRSQLSGKTHSGKTVSPPTQTSCRRPFALYLIAFLAQLCYSYYFYAREPSPNPLLSRPCSIIIAFLCPSQFHFRRNACWCFKNVRISTNLSSITALMSHLSYTY